MPDKIVYECPVCGLHYENEQIAKQCEGFCIANNSCNLQITQNSVERNSTKENSI